MARYDKVVPKNGVFRATLAAPFPKEQAEIPYGIGLNAQGLLVIGAGQTGILGVLVLTKHERAGARVDPMTHGEIVEFGPTDGVPGTDFGLPGKVYYSDADGNIGTLTDEVQTITITNPANPITLSFSGQGPTANIGPNPTAAQIQAALVGLSNVAPGDVTVTDDPGAADFRVKFGGAYKDTDVALMTATNATIGTATAGGATTGLVRVGHTVEGQRLVVRVEP